MSEPTVEERLSKLESQMFDLVSADSTAKPGKYDWISTIGMFGNDPIMKEICDEALRLREEDRECSRKEWGAEEKVAS